MEKLYPWGHMDCELALLSSCQLSPTFRHVARPQLAIYSDRH